MVILENFVSIIQKSVPTLHWIQSVNSSILLVERKIKEKHWLSLYLEFFIIH